MTPLQRDIVIYVGAIFAAILLAGVARWFVESRWEALLLAVMICIANGVVKALRPNHIILGRVSWLYFAVAWAFLIAGLFLLTDWSVLGYWTVPTVIGLGLAYCVVHLIIGPREDGAAKGR